MNRPKVASSGRRTARVLRGALATTGLGVGLLGCAGSPDADLAPGDPPSPAAGNERTLPGVGTGFGVPLGGGANPPSAAPTGLGIPATMEPSAALPLPPPTESETPPSTTGMGLSDVATATEDAPALGDPSGWNDPGSGPFEVVPEDQVGEVCKLDVDLLKSNFWSNGAVFRYGKLCYSQGRINNPYGVFSVTKTVAGTVMASAYWQTRENSERMLPSDPISKWGGTTGTRISEYAGMVTSGRFAYDTLGTNLARTGAPMVNSLRQGSVSGATSLAAVRDDLFEELGVSGRWPTNTWGTGATVSLEDMGRIGIALGHGGWWNGQQLLDPEWVYWMTHPQWENLNTSYGMYAWLNHRGNATGIGGTLSASGAGPSGGDPCAPAAVWQQYPHPPSQATDCNPASGNSCEQTYDAGVFSAQGLGGQFIVVHRGLDLVMVARSYSGQGGPTGLWSALRPALVELDPEFQGDEAAFCEAYGNGDYAPDMIVEPVQPPTQ